MNKLLIAYLIICVLIGVASVSGCVDNIQSTNNTDTIPSYEKHTIVCPNPDCPLHDPNYQFSSTYESNKRPTDLEYDPMGNSHYLCQVCGEKW